MVNFLASYSVVYAVTTPKVYLHYLKQVFVFDLHIK